MYHRQISSDGLYIALIMNSTRYSFCNMGMSVPNNSSDHNYCSHCYCRQFCHHHRNHRWTVFVRSELASPTVTLSQLSPTCGFRHHLQPGSHPTPTLPLLISLTLNMCEIHRTSFRSIWSALEDRALFTVSLTKSLITFVVLASCLPW